MDAGPGAGTISTWLADRVGPDGSVTALDTDTQHVLPHPLVDVVQADVSATDLGTAEYDGVHARLVLIHLPDRREVLGDLARALKPGAPLVISEWDCDYRDLVLDAPSRADGDLIDKYVETLISFFETIGMDSTWASKANRAMREEGLEEIRTVTYAASSAGGTGTCLLNATVSQMVEGPLLAGGMTPDEPAALPRA
nr:class I SAM-dependent methyltransferase [Angustibacter aerolatus]